MAAAARRPMPCAPAEAGEASAAPAHLEDGGRRTPPSHPGHRHVPWSVISGPDRADASHLPHPDPAAAVSCGPCAWPLSHSVGEHPICAAKARESALALP